MKILILGGGSAQLGLIKKAKEKGHEVVVSDYNPRAPGNLVADYSEPVSTFDVEGNIELAQKHNIDGVTTAGTDQPVYTAARVAEVLNLPFPLSISTARAVTNKEEMKKIFRQKGLPTVNYKLLGRDFHIEQIKELDFPVVVKPVDSQGQRGVYKLDSPAEVQEHVISALEYSRQSRVLVEEFFPGSEITVSGWVVKGKLFLLTVTDRLTYNDRVNIGVCTAHFFPSRYLFSHYEEIERLSQEIVAAFNIQNGPVYFQFLLRGQEIIVNEIAARIGGAYEGDFMPVLTGVDIFELAVDFSLDRIHVPESLKNYRLQENNRWLTVQLFFARPGRVKYISDINILLQQPGVLQAGFNIAEGEKIGEIKNATARAGYFIVIADDETTLNERIEHVFDRLKIISLEGDNLVSRSLGLRRLD